MYRIFKATADWQSFDVALTKNQEIWTENQYPSGPPVFLIFSIIVVITLLNRANLPPLYFQKRVRAGLNQTYTFSSLATPAVGE